MSKWKDFAKTQDWEDSLGDHSVPIKGDHLCDRRVALCVTGSIASFTVPSLARELRKYGADVQAFVTQDALKCGANICALEWATWPNPVITELTSASEHLSLNNPFDAYLVAPATANTIAKVASGISDTVVTGALASAIGRNVPILMAPAMHGSLHTPILNSALAELVERGVFLIAPFDAYGKHNIADKKTIVMDVCRMLSISPLKGLKILTTAGPTPVEIDSVRRITNRFSGKLGLIIAEELYRKGADSTLLQSYSGIRPPRYVPHELFKNYDDYRYQVMHTLGVTDYSTYERLVNRPHATHVHSKCKWAIFSAAVADYAPAEKLKGKTPSGGALETIPLVPTQKVIDLVHTAYPKLRMVTFKYEEGKEDEELEKIAQTRLREGHTIVVTNDGWKTGPDHEQLAHVRREGEPPHYAIGKRQIAEELVRTMEMIQEERDDEKH